MRNSFLLYILFSITMLLLHLDVRSQCSITISAFPYNENFEGGNNGNWVTNAPTIWECGTPSPGKPVINTPGGGLKSWVVGGLTGNTYSTGNWQLVSPCFDFTALVKPEIKFKIFWETEQRWDGATFQYSLDQGNSWTTLGTANSNSTCDGANWFTYPSITPYLGGEPGWSGNIQTSGGGDGSGTCLYGLGSGRWVDAKHTMAMLAGEPSVTFRFLFGAGTQCNNFAGFAIDNVHIGETPPPGIADFTYSCGTNGEVFFTNNSAACSVSWDFGDPLSATDNFSTDENPSHVFSVTGQSYIVTLTANFLTGPITKTVTIYTLATGGSLGLSNKCAGDSTAEIFLNPAGSPSGNYTYSWNTNPVQNTPDVVVPQGEYDVVVTATNACSATQHFSIVDPPVLNVTAVPLPALCGSNSGSITSTVTGGVAPYAYSWNTTPVSTTASVNDLAPGNYNLTVTDFNGCVKQQNGIQVLATVKTLDVSLGQNTTICTGKTLVLDPGSFQSYKWQDSTTTSTYTVTRTGTYSVKVKDNNGCVGFDSVRVTVEECKGIFFPSAFTPNADGLNPTFSAVGDLSSLSNFSLVVYNRYAEVIFISSDVYKGWDGTSKGAAQDAGTYVWTAKYTVRGQKPVFKKGTVLVIR